MDETLSQLVDQGIKEELSVEEHTLQFDTPEEWSAASGKRFRMTKSEMEQFGKTKEGRQLAFEARQVAGDL